MSEAIVIRSFGEPDVLRLEQREVGAPKAGQLKLKQQAIGVNFHDAYVRSGQYRTLDLPGIPGLEAVATVSEVGAGVSDFKPGDRVAYVDSGYGAYASERLLSAALALRVPDSMDAKLLAGSFLKGLTVDMLVNRVQKIKAGDTVLVHAAAGGVGRMLCQWAAHQGATVIGSVGSEAKVQIAQQAGCKHVVLYRLGKLVEEVRDITGGRGVDVVYDSVGKDTFDASLEMLALRGHLVNFGQASGPIDPFMVSRLAGKSNSVTRPMLFHYIDTPASLAEMSQRFFTGLDQGWVSAADPLAMPLANASDAHALLQSGKAMQPLVLLT